MMTRSTCMGTGALLTALTAVTTFASAGPLMELSTLSPTAGEPVDVRLHLPTGENWANANIGAFFVRQGKQQWSVPIDPRDGGDVVRLTFDRPGTALVVLSAGRSEDRGFSDSWQRTPYCSKAIVRVQPGEAGADVEPTVGDGVTGKVGHKIEILPLAHPATLRRGDDLPVRVYAAGDKRTGIAVSAHVRSPGRSQPVAVTARRPTDPVGTTWIALEHTGTWRVFWSEEVDGVTHWAELIFDLAADAAHGPPNAAHGPANAATGPVDAATGPPNAATGPPNAAHGPADAATGSGEATDAAEPDANGGWR